MYADAVATVRIGYNALVVLLGEIIHRPLPVKLNMTKVYSTALACDVTADRMTVDRTRAEFTLTMFATP